jgi:hypothetical protein
MGLIKAAIIIAVALIGQYFLNKYKNELYEKSPFIKKYLSKYIDAVLNNEPLVLLIIIILIILLF